MATINNVAYDGTTIDVEVEGVGTFEGVESVNWGYTHEYTHVKGVGAKRTGRTPGVLNPDDASMEIWLSQYEAWKDASGGLDQMMRGEFDVSVTYTVEGEPLKKVTLKNCRMNNVSAAHSTSSTDNLVVTVSFSPLDIE